MLDVIVVETIFPHRRVQNHAAQYLGKPSKMWINSY